MSKINFSIFINATPQKVWQVLWNDKTYREWTKAFQDGSYAVSDWKEGASIEFLTTDGSGIFSVINELIPNKVMSFKHLGILKNFEKQSESEETRKWGNALETYTLSEEKEGTQLQVEMNSIDEYINFFNKTFPKALEVVKELSENPIVLVVEVLINSTIDNVWKYWTDPKHIIGWYYASDDWHSPRAVNDLVVGSKFLTRMEARDGSFGFDLEGTYTDIIFHQQINYNLIDGRRVQTSFETIGNSVRVVEAFDAEAENSLDLQQGGWQAILNNLKKYTESN